MKTLRLYFEDKEFKQLQNDKETLKINGECDNWEDYILKLATVRAINSTKGGRAR